MRASFKGAAKAVTAPPMPAPKPRRRRRGGTDSRSLVGLAIVADYVNLCRNPAGDLMRWLEELDGPPGAVRFIRPTKMGATHEHTRAFRQPRSDLADARGLRRDALHQVRDGLDTNRARGRPDGLSARSHAGARRYDGLRPLQTLQRRNLTLAGGRDPHIRDHGPPDASGVFAAELGAVSAHYAARIAAVRASARPGDVAALLRALKDEQVLAEREVISRWQASALHDAQLRRMATKTASSRIAEPTLS